MTSNIGMEYINLKQAKYNRERREQKRMPVTETASSHRSVSAASRPTYASASSAAAVSRTSQMHSSTSTKRTKTAASDARRVGRTRSTAKVRTASRSHGTPALAYAGVQASAVSVPTGQVDGGLLGDIVGDIGKAVAKKRKEAARARATETKYVKKSVKAAQPFPIAVIGYTLVFAAIAMYLVLGNSKINEATLRADSLKSAITAEAERSEVLSSALNQRKDIGYIEDYAENVLGMVKSTDVAKHYVSVSGEDKIAVRGVSVSPEAGTVASDGANG